MVVYDMSGRICVNLGGTAEANSFCPSVAGAKAVFYFGMSENYLKRGWQHEKNSTQNLPERRSNS